MSSESRPITSSQFALAIRDLPLENLYAKAKEIENSIAHLQRSNKQLQEYSDSIKQDQSLSGEVREEVGDKECLEAIRENEVVIERQRERVGLLKSEAESRGGGWHNGEDGGDGRVNGSGRGGRLTDEELRRRMEERMGAGEEEEEEGMHL
jgi:hypothetical protein